MPHPTSKLYQQALAELREKHPKEFNRIYARIREEAGMAPRSQREMAKDRIIEVVKRNPNIKRGQLCAYADVTDSSLTNYVRDLVAEGRLIAPGRGSSTYAGFRLPTKRP